MDNRLRTRLLALAFAALVVQCGGEPPAATAPNDAAEAAGTSDAATHAETAPTSDGTATDGAMDGTADATPASWSQPPPKPDGALSVMTYNVMCSFCVNKDHPEYEQKWSTRLPWLRDVFARFDPDLIGLQENQAQLPTDGNVPEIEQLIGPQKLYEAFHYKFKEGDENPYDYPDATVLWKKSRFDKLADGVIWLSPEPDKPYSTGFAKMQFARVMAWVKLRDKQRNRDVIFATTHFDNNSPSQEKSAPLVLEKLGPLAKDATLILTGDYNSKPNSKAYGLLAAGQTGVSPPWQDTFDLAKAWTIVHNQATKPAYDTANRIDHVYVASPSAKFTVSWWGLDLWLYGAKKQPPSDHDGAIVAHIDW